MNPHLIHDTQVEALFLSDLQPSEPLTPGALRAAIARMVRAHGSRGCAALVAQEFGEHPETAVARMCWARREVARVTARPPLAA